MPFDTQECGLELGSYSVKTNVNLTIPLNLTAKDLITLVGNLTFTCSFKNWQFGLFTTTILKKKISKSFAKNPRKSRELYE